MPVRLAQFLLLPSSVHADRASDLGAASALMNAAREPRHSSAGTDVCAHLQADVASAAAPQPPPARARAEISPFSRHACGPCKRSGDQLDINRLRLRRHHKDEGTASMLFVFSL